MMTWLEPGGMKRVDDDTIFVFVQLILCEYLMRFFVIAYNYLSELQMIKTDNYKKSFIRLT
jgi:hypothetical protein